MITKNLIKFNVNHYIYIQINERGWEHLRKTVTPDYIEHCIESYKEVIGGEDWYKLQMHHVFDLFPISMSQPVMFNTNILVESQSPEPLREELIKFYSWKCKNNKFSGTDGTVESIVDEYLNSKSEKVSTCPECGDPRNNHKDNCNFEYRAD